MDNVYIPWWPLRLRREPQVRKEAHIFYGVRWPKLWHICHKTSARSDKVEKWRLSVLGRNVPTGSSGDRRFFQLTVFREMSNKDASHSKVKRSVLNWTLGISQKEGKRLFLFADESKLSVLREMCNKDSPHSKVKHQHSYILWTMCTSSDDFSNCVEDLK